jgi:general stress protein YciG
MKDRDRQRAIASQGGIASHAQGTAHEWTKEECRAMGSKGGRTTAARRWAREHPLLVETEQTAHDDQQEPEEDLARRDTSR